MRDGGSSSADGTESMLITGGERQDAQDRTDTVYYLSVGTQTDALGPFEAAPPVLVERAALAWAGSVIDVGPPAAGVSDGRITEPRQVAGVLGTQRRVDPLRPL